MALAVILPQHTLLCSMAAVVSDATSLLSNIWHPHQAPVSHNLHGKQKGIAALFTVVLEPDCIVWVSVVVIAAGDDISTLRGFFSM